MKMTNQQQQDVKVIMDSYFNALGDAKLIKDYEMRQRYVESLDSLWRDESLSNEVRVEMAKQGVHQAKFYGEMIEANKSSINNVEAYQMWAMDKVEETIDRALGRMF